MSVITNELADRIIERFDEIVGEAEKHRKRFAPSISKLSDMEFAGLLLAVLTERDKRIQDLDEKIAELLNRS